MSKLSDEQIKASKTERIMQIVDERAGYYRANPQRFVEEFLGIKLKLFQKILIWAMVHFDNFYFVAARGIGKTYLTALFSVVMAILYPGSKIICVSYTFKQGREIVLKIKDDFMQKSALLRNEIESIKDGQNDCVVRFKNGSFIRVVTATESSRGARSTILVIDESRLVSQKIVDTILRPMNAAPRTPGYLNNPEYSHLKEMNKEMYLSSAYYAASEMYDKVKSYMANMLNPKLKYFVTDLPYMLSIKEGLLMREAIINEKSEATFNDVSFSMEREGLFYGSSEDALFDFKLLNERRVIKECLHDLDYYRMNNLNVPEKQKGEIRVLSVDVALLASKKHNNDASALMIHSAIPTSSHNYMDNITYIDTKEGLVTDEVGLLVMRYYYQYNCDYIGLDATGIGQAILDYIMADRFDPIYNQAYGALNCINNAELAERCKVNSAPKVVFAIKGSQKLNNDLAVSLRSGFQNGNINLLLPDSDAENIITKVRGYSKMTDSQKSMLLLPYVQTSFLVNELVNLDHDVSGGMIRVKEKSGMRKDRYSSCAYGYYVVQELSKQLKPKASTNDILKMLTIRPAKNNRR